MRNTFIFMVSVADEWWATWSTEGSTVMKLDTCIDVKPCNVLHKAPLIPKLNPSWWYVFIER